MNNRAQALRKSLLAKAHLAPKQLGMSDDDRRAILQSLFGVESCKHLSNKQLGQLLAHFERCGWEPKEKKPIRTGRGAQEPAMLAKVEALLAELANEKGDWHPWNYAHAILRRMYKVDRLEWADARQLRGVIAALWKHLQRREQANLAPEVVEAEQAAFKRHFPTPAFKQTAGGRA